MTTSPDDQATAALVERANNLKAIDQHTMMVFADDVLALAKRVEDAERKLKNYKKWMELHEGARNSLICHLEYRDERLATLEAENAALRLGHSGFAYDLPPVAVPWDTTEARKFIRQHQDTCDKPSFESASFSDGSYNLTCQRCWKTLS